jgi:hypothetical protein
MKRYAVFFLLLIIVCFSVSCKSKPPVKAEEPVAQGPSGQTKQQGTGPTAAVFDPSSISQVEKDTSMQEIRQLTQQLNTIIRAKNYNAWITYLDPGYLATINSREFLDNVSKSPTLVKQKIALNSAYDYFINVVVPSRANSRVDDIEFVSKNRVKAYTIDNKENRLRLFDLEKTGTGWKIIG